MTCDSSGKCTYTSNFAIEGKYTFVIWAVDDDDNWDSETDSFDIVPSTEKPIELNWKPIIALMFAIILLLLGLLVSYNRPIGFKGMLRSDRVYTFIICSLPFVIAEILTGIVSLITGLLSVPPLLGLGMAVDLVIIILGIVVYLIILRKGKRPDSYEEDSIEEPIPPTHVQEPGTPGTALPPQGGGPVPPGSVCRNCGHVLEPDYVMCPNCGTKI
jgi:hypothetical protein